MRTLAVRTLAIAAMGLSTFASTASAQTTISQWNWNTTTGSAYNKPWTGTVLSGTVGGYGQGAPTAPLSSILTSGAAIDPGTVVTGTTYNRAAIINPPLTSTSNISTGVWFSAPTTGMNAGEAVKLSWSQTIGYRSSRYWQLLVSTTGGTTGFSVPSGATGSSISQFITGMTSGSAALSGTATVNVSSTGLIDFRTLNNLSLAPAQITTTVTPANFATGFVDNISITLPTGQGYENNPNFAFAIVGAFDPAYGGTSGTNGYVSSFAGTDSTDAVNGYNRSVASGGSMRLDLMTVSAVSAVPEPAISALGASALIGAAAAWRRRRRSHNEA